MNRHLSPLTWYQLPWSLIQPTLSAETVVKADSTDLTDSTNSTDSTFTAVNLCAIELKAKWWCLCGGFGSGYGIRDAGFYWFKQQPSFADASEGEASDHRNIFHVLWSIKYLCNSLKSVQKKLPGVAFPGCLGLMDGCKAFDCNAFGRVWLRPVSHRMGRLSRACMIDLG